MVVYPDAVFVLNLLADGGALWITAVLCGSSVSLRRLIPAALLGGTYGVLCCLPGLSFLGCRPVGAAVSVGLVCLTFRGCRGFWRRAALFHLLSYTMAGAMTALTQRGGQLTWVVFLLGVGGCYGVLSLVFRGSACHGVAGELSCLRLVCGGREINLTALLDTGHTLTDPVTGERVITVFWEAVTDLFPSEERKILSQLKLLGAVYCLQRLPAGRFHLLPYRAVGVESGLLLCLRAEEVWAYGKALGPMPVALSPTPVSDGGGYVALWNGTGKEAAEDAG